MSNTLYFSKVFDNKQDRRGEIFSSTRDFLSVYIFFIIMKVNYLLVLSCNEISK